jgi:hypothetical protein
MKSEKSFFIIIFSFLGMEHLLQSFQKRLKQRKLYRPAVWLVVKELCKQYAVDPSALQIKLRWRSCTILLSTKEDKTTWFLKKAELLERINKKLADDGREIQFDEIRIT